MHVEILINMCMHAWYFASVVSSSLQPKLCQASLSMGFSRQEHWSGLPCPPPRYVYTHLKTYTQCMDMHVFVYIYVYTCIIDIYVCGDTDMHVYTHTHTHTQFSCSLSWEDRDDDTPDATSMASILVLFLAPFFRKRNQGFLNKWLIIGLGDM